MSEDVSRTTSPDVTVAEPAVGQGPGADRPDAYAKKAVLGSALGYAMDGFDLLILGFALAAITASIGLKPTEAASLATITLWGAVVGGLVFGILSDYLGRVRVLTWSIVVFAVFTGLTAISQSYLEIAAFRFIAGVGLGAEFGIGMTLAAEAWPARLRARATSLVGLGWQSGVLVAAFVAPAVIAHWGWRALFAIGVAPALLAFAFRRTLAEPEKFVQSNARRRREKFPLRLLFSDARTTRASIGVLVLTSVQNFGYYGIMIWLPSYLSKQFGFTLTKSGVWTAVTVLGMAFGIYVFGHLADTVGRRRSFWLFQAGAVVSVLVYSQLSSSVALLIGGAIMGIFVNGMLGGYGALMAELYPTAARATAQNVLFNIGRGVGGLGPIWIAWVATNHGFSYAIALLACIYLLDMVAMVFIPERSGAELPA
jgi:MFS family permease